MTDQPDIDCISGAKLLIVGDMMLDRYVYGAVERISPEAPIPVLRRGLSKDMPGGAANVAVNARALGATVSLLGVAADDTEGRILRDLLASGPYAVPARLFGEPGRPTTTKTRYVANGQQLLRVDRESTAPIGMSTESALLADVEQRLAEANLVVISDYAKGVLTDRVVAGIIALARAAGKPVVVDPKRSDFTIYRGAAMIKPNLQELQRATGVVCDTPEHVEQAAMAVIEATGSEILVTRASRGMSLYRQGAPAQHLDAVAREVFDVSGAGDSALAALAAGLGGGATPLAAMRLANIAAGLAVSKLGTAVVTGRELRDALAEKVFLEPLDRVVGPDEISALCRTWRAHGEKIGFTNGCFDILHAGHVSLLAKASAACDRLVVGLNSDASVKRLKGPSRPAQLEQSRARVLASLVGVDAVCIFEQDTPIELITAIRPDVLIKGADYTVDRVVGADFVKGYGGEIVLVDLVAGHSTTATLRQFERLARAER